MKSNFKKAFILILTLCLTMGCLTFPASAATDSRVERAIAWAVSIANDNTHGYSMTNRNGPNYDCSSFVSTAFKQGGFNVSGNNWTGSMEQAFKSVGFKSYAAGSVTLQRGDILLRHDSVQQHVELYIGNNQCVAAHWDDDGRSGDSGGHEIEVRSKAYCDFCNYKQYTRVLRYEGNPTSLSLSASSVTLAVGQTQKINFNFKGSGIQSISFGFSDDNKGSNSLCKASFGSVDWSKGTGTINIQPRSNTTGQANFTVWLWGANGKILAQKTISFKVVQSTQIISLSSPVKISIPKGNLACLYTNPDDKVECCLVDARNASFTIQSKKYCVLADGSRRYEVAVSGGRMLWLAIDATMTVK